MDWPHAKFTVVPLTAAVKETLLLEETPIAKSSPVVELQLKSQTLINNLLPGVNPVYDKLNTSAPVIQVPYKVKPPLQGLLSASTYAWALKLFVVAIKKSGLTATVILPEFGMVAENQTPSQASLDVKPHAPDGSGVPIGLDVTPQVSTVSVNCPLSKERALQGNELVADVNFENIRTCRPLLLQFKSYNLK